MGGGNEAAHVDHAATAKEHAVAVADDDLARCSNTAQDGAGLGASDAVEGGAAGVVEVHVGVFAHIEALPVEHCALAGLVDDHVGAALLDGGAACGHAAAGGQSIVGHLSKGWSDSSERTNGQGQGAGQGFGDPGAGVVMPSGVGQGLAAQSCALGFAA